MGNYSTRNFFTDEKIIMNMKNCRSAILTNEYLFKKSIFRTYLFMILGSLFTVVGIIVYFILNAVFLSVIILLCATTLYLIFFYRKYFLNGLFSITLDAIADNREIDEEAFTSFYKVLDNRIGSMIWFDLVLFFKNMFLPGITLFGLLISGNYIIYLFETNKTTEIIIMGIYTILICIIFYILFFKNNYIHMISKFMILDMYRKHGYSVSEADLFYNELKISSPISELLSLNVYSVSKEFGSYIMFIPQDAISISTKMHRAVSGIPFIGSILGFFLIHIEFFQDIHMLGFKSFVSYAYYSSAYEYCRAQSPGIGKAWINNDFYII